MPSNSLLRWQTDRVPRLNALVGQISAAPPSTLTDENLRALVAILCAHFQGFCRDLYTEATTAFAAALPSPFGAVSHRQFMAQITLGTGNPNLQSLTRDFDRFGISLKAELDKNSSNGLRVNHLALLNQWRNYVVHHGVVAPLGPPLDLVTVTTWQGSCDALATELDRIVYDYFLTLLNIAPW